TGRPLRSASRPILPNRCSAQSPGNGRRRPRAGCWCRTPHCCPVSTRTCRSTLAAPTAANGGWCRGVPPWVVVDGRMPMAGEARRYLMFVELPYSFEILRPLQAAARARSAEVAWFLNGPAPSHLDRGERLLRSVAAVAAFAPHAVFVPGNEVPPFFPGLKVQVFHGFAIEKKGHFRIRGMFDLFCTFGPLTTGPFEALARRHGWFRVAETGWPKVDPLFDASPVRTAGAARRVLYAPTFSPSLTSAPALAETIRGIVARRDWQW